MFTSTPDDPISALYEWLRVLKPGGHIDTMMPNSHSLTLLLYRVLFCEKVKKLGFKYFDLVNALEHKNIIKYFLLSLKKFIDFEFHNYPRFLGKFKLLRVNSALIVKNHLNCIEFY